MSKLLISIILQERLYIIAVIIFFAGGKSRGTFSRVGLFEEVRYSRDYEILETEVLFAWNTAYTLRVRKAKLGNLNFSRVSQRKIENFTRGGLPMTVGGFDISSEKICLLRSIICDLRASWRINKKAAKQNSSQLGLWWFTDKGYENLCSQFVIFNVLGMFFA